MTHAMNKELREAVARALAKSMNCEWALQGDEDIAVVLAHADAAISIIRPAVLEEAAEAAEADETDHEFPSLIKDNIASAIRALAKEG